MNRLALPIATSLISMIVLSACTTIINLTQYKYPPRAADAEVELIDARNMSRPELQRVLDNYDILGRFHAMIRSGERYEQDVTETVEAAKVKVRERGGHALLYTEDSEMIAAIYQDVGYAGPDDRLVMYIMRRKET